MIGKIPLGSYSGTASQTIPYSFKAGAMMGRDKGKTIENFYSLKV